MNKQIQKKLTEDLSKLQLSKIRGGGDYNKPDEGEGHAGSTRPRPPK
jgi:hypothetical protein